MITRSVLFRYLFAAASALAAIGLRAALDPLLQEGHFTYSLFFLVVLGVAWLAGLGPSLAALIVSLLGAFLLIFRREHDHSAGGLMPAVELAVFLLLGLAFAAVGSSMRRVRIERSAADEDAARGRSARLSRADPILAPITIFLISLAATALIAQQVWKNAGLKDRERFQNILERTEDRIDQRIETYIAILNAGRGLFAASGDVSREQFHDFVRQFDIAESYPGIQGVGFSRRVPAAEKDDFVRGLAPPGPGGGERLPFKIWPEYERPEYHTIVYLEPLDRRNRAAIGYDMFTEASRRDAMERARDTGAAAASAKVTLVQEIDEHKQAGFLIYVPVYRGGRVPDTVEQRRADLIGYVYSPFRAEDLFRGIFGSESRPRIEFEVYDGDRVTPEALLRPGGENYRPQAASQTEVVTMSVAGRPWTIAFATRPEFDVSSSRAFGWIVVVGGFLVSLSLFGIAWEQAHTLAERQRSELALRASESRLRGTLESITDGFLSVDGEWRFTYVNAEAERICNFRREDVIGRTWQEVFPPAVGSEVERSLRRCATERVPVELETFYEPWQRWFQFRAYPTPDGGFSQYFRDITQQKFDEEQRARWQEMFSRLIDICPFGIYIVDSDLRIAQMNIGTRDGAFANVRPIVGRPLDEAMHIIWPTDVADEIVTAFRRTLETGEPYFSRDFVNPRADKDAVEGYEWQLHRLVLPDGRPGVVCYYYDSTRLRQAEQELVNSNEREKQLRVEAESASRAKDDFLALLSHELRTPLNSIYGWTQLILQSRDDDATVERGIEIIAKNVRLQNALIEDLLDVSRIISGRMQIATRIEPLVPIIQSAVEAAIPSAEGADLSLVMNIEDDPGPVAADRQRLQQVISNLLTNAIKFTPAGGTITVSLERSDAGARIVVADTGIGIEPQLLPEIFQPFWQVDATYKRKHGGLGLGLAIVRNLVELHHGTVAVHSDGPGRGTSFTIELPAAPQAEPETGVDKPAPIATGRGDHSAETNGFPNIKVLIVDDDLDNRELIRTALESSGARTDVSGSPAEALEKLAAGGYDILISDIGMPEIDGFDLISAVRSMDPPLRDIPAIALSGYASAGDRRRALDSGFQAHLSKPVDLVLLRRRIIELAAPRSR
ncbi:MAG: CHASE domain-containing protein [Pyrinomonadaceae bacterium]